VIAIGRTAAKLEKALKLGAEVRVNAAEESVAERIREITEGTGADVVFETVSALKSR
jgi:threonine dehydrogenase-like Zn-dependent dehydrogenase